jgi:hypothetical protein
MNTIHESYPTTAPQGSVPDTVHPHDFRNVADAMGAGRRAAEAKAKNSVPALKQVLKSAVHDLAYGTAFSVCFAGYFARELVPEDLRSTVVRGLKRGQTAAQAAAAELRGPATTPAPVEI